MNEALQQAGNNKLQLWFVNYASYVLCLQQKNALKLTTLSSSGI